MPTSAYLQAPSGACKDLDASTSQANVQLPGIMPEDLLLIEPQTQVGISGGIYSLLPRLPDVLVRVKKGSYVDCLSSPDVAVDCPVEG